MNPTQGTPRWQYSISWRYGHLLLTVAGLALLALGANDVEPTTISVTMMTLGFLMAVLGVAFPRMRGTFTADPAGIGADMLPIADVDPLIAVVSVPAAAPALAIEGPAAQVSRGALRIGDVRDALVEADFRAVEQMGTISYQGPDGRGIRLPGTRVLDDEPVSDDLAKTLNALAIHLVASGKYRQPGEDG